jgi:hypothetical protein
LRIRRRQLAFEKALFLEFAPNLRRRPRIQLLHVGNLLRRQMRQLANEMNKMSRRLFTVGIAR